MSGNNSFQPSLYLRNSQIQTILVPTTIITATDDPIIPFEDFYQLKLNHLTKLIIHTHGGHNGFIDSFFLKSWYEQKLVNLFAEIAIRAGMPDGLKA